MTYSRAPSTERPRGQYGDPEDQGVGPPDPGWSPLTHQLLITSPPPKTNQSHWRSCLHSSGSIGGLQVFWGPKRPFR